MITRLYVDNYRCLVNFDLKLPRSSLLLGENGAGKTTAFEVIDALRQFVTGEARVDRLFPYWSATRWTARNKQTFAIEARLPGLDEEEGVFRYELEVEHVPTPHMDQAFKSSVARESLSFKEGSLFLLERGEARMFFDNHVEGPKVLIDPLQSGVALVPPRPDSQLLIRFRQFMAGVIVVGFNPFQMSGSSKHVNYTPRGRFENFASWYRFLSYNDQASAFELTKELRDVMPGFFSFRFSQFSQDNFELEVGFGASDAQYWLLFTDLSEGQKVFIALYALLCARPRSMNALFLDEPENFLGLREIQPWLRRLMDRCPDPIGQICLISHHPEMIDYLGLTKAIWFHRSDMVSPTRLPSHDLPDDGLKLSESIARGLIE